MSNEITEVTVKGTPDQVDTLLESGELSPVLESLTAEFDAETEQTHVHALVSLTYSGPVSKENAGEILTNALEHCREEGLLSDPEWANDPATEELGCDAVRCRIL